MKKQCSGKQLGIHSGKKYIAGLAVLLNFIILWFFIKLRFADISVVYKLCLVLMLALLPISVLFYMVPVKELRCKDGLKTWISSLKYHLFGIIICGAYVFLIGLFWLLEFNLHTYIALSMLYINLVSSVGLNNHAKQNRFFLAGKNIFIMLASLYVNFLSIQFLITWHWNRTLTNSYWFINILLLLVPGTVFVLLCNSKRIGMVCMSLLSLFWGLLNYFVYTFKGQPFQLSDFAGMTTAIDVLPGYDIALPAFFLRSVLFLLTIQFILILNMSPGGLVKSLKAKIGIRAGALILLVSYCLVILYTPMISGMNLVLKHWRLDLTYIDNGVPLATYYVALEGRVQVPPDYRPEKVEQIYSDLIMPQEVRTVKPNLLVIMNESLADLSVMNTIETTEEVMPFIDSLEENTLKGKLLVSTFGGGTPRTEFEFLTGHSMFLLGQQKYVYGQDIHEKQYSLVTTLESQGYDTVAMHPENGDNWNRNSVYNYFDFDTFYDIGYFKDSELFREKVSDKANYEKMLDVLEQKGDSPLFLFNVTMQNHGGYTWEDFENTVHIKDYEDSQVGQYLTLIKESDAAFAYLISKLKTFEEPTVVVMFGDHFPSLPEEFYTWLAQTPRSEWSAEMLQRQHMVPYIIWANYPLGAAEAKELLSANYLSSYVLEVVGLKKAPYNQFLLQGMEEVPAMNTYGYYDKAGLLHDYKEEEENSFLQNYAYVEYNGFLDHGHRRDAMFVCD